MQRTCLILLWKRLHQSIIKDQFFFWWLCQLIKRKGCINTKQSIIWLFMYTLHSISTCLRGSDFISKLHFISELIYRLQGVLVRRVEPTSDANNILKEVCWHFKASGACCIEFHSFLSSWLPNTSSASGIWLVFYYLQCFMCFKLWYYLWISRGTWL